MTGAETKSQAAWTPGQPVVLNGPRLCLRSMTAAEVTDRYISWFADPRVMHNITMEMNLGREALLDFVASFNNRDRFHFGVFLQDTGEQIGWMKLLCDQPNRKGQLTTVIGEPDHWGKGYGYEMRALVIDFMFGPLGLHKAISMVYGDNPKTFGLNTKLGFQREGILREDETGPKGERRDVHVFGLLSHEWQGPVYKK
jgi:RimJ/RimL family protein N-acetyltransferase